MKVLMINGSPHKEGNTATALQEMKKVFEQEGIEAEIVNIGNDAIRGCVPVEPVVSLVNVYMTIW